MTKFEELKALGWDMKDIAKLLDELKHSAEYESFNNCNEKTTINSVNRIDIEKRVTYLLKKIGVPFNLKGTYYVKTAILYYLEQNNSFTNKMYEVYAYVAKQFNTTPNSVEKAIRHAVEETFDNCSPLTNQIFEYAINSDKGKATNKEFIWMLVEYLRIS